MVFWWFCGFGRTCFDRMFVGVLLTQKLGQRGRSVHSKLNVGSMRHFWKSFLKVTYETNHETRGL